MQHVVASASDGMRALLVYPTDVVLAETTQNSFLLEVYEVHTSQFLLREQTIENLHLDPLKH